MEKSFLKTCFTQHVKEVKVEKEEEEEEEKEKRIGLKMPRDYTVENKFR